MGCGIAEVLDKVIPEGLPISGGKCEFVRTFLMRGVTQSFVDVVLLSMFKATTILLFASWNLEGW